MAKILIVEDEADMVEGLKFNLEARGFSVIAAFDGETGFNMALSEKPELILLDIMLPRKNGFDVCRDVKRELPELPVIMLTAKSQESEVVAGLDLGADDYIKKPFSVLELISRINAVLRRVNHDSKYPEKFRFGNIEVDFRVYTAKKKNRPISLSPREFEILKYFIGNRGEVISREELLDEVWGYNSFPNTRTVDAHIAKLRQKIEDNADDSKYIITIHSIGYKFIG